MCSVSPYGSIPPRIPSASRYWRTPYSYATHRSLVQYIHYDTELPLVTPFSNKRHPPDFNKPTEDLREGRRRRSTAQPLRWDDSEATLELTILLPLGYVHEEDNHMRMRNTLNGKLRVTFGHY